MGPEAAAPPAPARHRCPMHRQRSQALRRDQPIQAARVLASVIAAIAAPAKAAPLGVGAGVGLVAGALACLRLPGLAPSWLLAVLLVAGLAGWWRVAGRWRWGGAMLAGFALCGL